jgi:type IV secretory pathway VirB2 component (pilin)
MRIIGYGVIVIGVNLIIGWCDLDWTSTASVLVGIDLASLEQTGLMCSGARRWILPP